MENSITVKYLKDLPNVINDYTLLSVLDKVESLRPISDYTKLNAEYIIFRTIVTSLGEDSQNSNYARLYIRI